MECGISIAKKYGLVQIGHTYLIFEILLKIAANSSQI